MHCRQSGVADHYAENDEHALSIARNLVKHLNRLTPKRLHQGAREPLYPAHELNGIIPLDSRQPFDSREVIARIVDDSDFDEFKPLFGTSLICGFAFIHGYPIGILANNGVLFSESALKGVHFIELCAKRKIPMLFLQNINGFMVGSHYEASGITKHGAKMVMAVANAQVPKLTVITGGSFGAGNYAMCGRAYDPRFLWCWPNARVAVMGGAQASHVLASLKRDKKDKHNQPWSELEEAEFKARLHQQYETQSDAYYASARLWDDGIIAPHDTRNILGLALWIIHHAPIESTLWGIFRM